ncbi:O-antigen ligase family protein [Planococcus halocryophilus]|uniref:O-antigen ligase family protein n=1 Tax=Planococcus halocryophilus TaxID=1215089 RepID=UPI001F112599|nr:O-antigen ligase family protein [Planococcus halocryophilus]MCH4826788.1 O-antigen ligase family protein [Planococcus halocryophilus]
MELIILLAISFAAFLLIAKYKDMGLVYTLIFLIPFRLEIISLNGIGIRITDIIAILFFLIWILKILSNKEKKHKIKTILPIIIFLLIVIISFLINAFRFSSVENSIDLLRFLLAIFTGIAVYSSIQNKKDIFSILIVWIFAATSSSIISILSFFFNGNGISTLLEFNNLSVVEFYTLKFSNSIFFEDPNNLATYLIISIFITLGIAFSSHVSIKYKYLILSIQLLGLILTMSRSAYLGGAVAFLIFFLFHKSKSYSRILIKIIVILSLFPLTFSFYKAIDSDVSAMSRYELWQVGLNMTLSNPIFGVGIGNSSIVFDQYINSKLLIPNPHFHNLFLTISSEMGIVGLFAFTLIFIKYILNWNKYNDVLYMFLSLGLVAYLVQSMGVEYFASRHFWIFIPLLIKYKSFLVEGSKSVDVSISPNTSI